MKGAAYKEENRSRFSCQLRIEREWSLDGRRVAAADKENGSHVRHARLGEGY